jgi:hypothetical protein
MGGIRRSRKRRAGASRYAAWRRQLGLEHLEDKRLLAVTVDFNAATGDLLFVDDNVGTVDNVVSLYMQDAVGSSLYYSINGGPLTPTPTPLGSGPQAGVTGVRFIDASSSTATSGDTLQVFGFGGGSFAVSGKNLVFGGSLPITTLNVENLVLDGFESLATMSFDGVGVIGSVTARNATVTTVAGTSAYRIGGNLTIDTNTLQLNGALSAGGTATLSLSGGINQSVASPITAATLIVTNSIAGDVLLTNSRNAVDAVAITNLADGGNVAYADADSLNVGVSGVGIVANNATSVTVASGGVLRLNANVDSGDGTVLLTAANGVSQAAAVGVIGQALTVMNGTGLTPSGNIDLAGALNNVDTIAARNAASAGSITYTNSTGLAIGAGVSGVNGLTANSGRISVTTANGPLTIQQGVAAGNGGEVVLAAGRGITQSGAGVVSGRQLSLSNSTDGLIDLGLPGNDVQFLAAVNSTPNGTILYQDASGFAVGIGGITTTGASGAVTLVSQGSVTQLGAIVTRTLSLENQSVATGSLLLPLVTNDVAFLNVYNAFAGGTIRYADANAFDLGAVGVDAAGNAVFLAAVGTLGQEGDIVARALDVRQGGAGGVAFTNATNSISALTGSIGTGTMAVVTQTPLAIGVAGISASAASVDLATAGSLTQSGAVTAQSLNVANSSTLAGDILLESKGNAIATFTASNAFGDGVLSLQNATAMVVGVAGIDAPGNDVTLTVNGALTQAGSVIAGDFTAVNRSAATGGIVLDLTTNDVASFAASNAAVADIVYRDVDEFSIGLGGINSRANISLTSVGDITQQASGSIVGQRLSVTNLSDQVGSNIVLGLATNNVRSFVGVNESPNGMVSLRTNSALTIGAAGSGVSVNQGSVSIQSAGKMTLVAGIVAGQDEEPGTLRSVVNLTATGGIVQTGGAVVANDLVAVNNGVGEIRLTQAANDVDRFASRSTGGISYVDIDSFETGVRRAGSLGDQVVEVSTAGILRLQAGGAESDALRIVGGLSFGAGKLFLSAGTAATPGIVEYVTTSKASGGTTFSGSLRDMIGYANVNQARVGNVVTPQSIVFDASGYAVDEITVAAALPAVAQRVTIDGTRVESSLVATPRVGIRASSAATTGNGLLLASGGAGSSVRGLAITGFTRGAGIQLQGADNTVTNTYLGVQRDGATLSGNKYGIEMNVPGSTGNEIGGAPINFGVPDDQVANVIGGNAVAGVMVQGGAAGNTIRGNFIGTDASGARLSNSGSGVQVVATADTLVSENVIAGNLGDGVLINVAAATAASPNRIFANEIRDHAAGAGVRVSNSAFAVIGGSGSGNVIGRNGVGIQLENRSSAVAVSGNFIGTDAAGARLGNTSHGVIVINSIGNTIGGVATDLGNVSAFNGGSGIVVRNSVAASVSAGNRLLSNVADQNARHGILVEGGGLNTIGGSTAGNVSTRNGGDGIRVQSFVGAAARSASFGNQVLGNLVGTDSRVGSVDRGNLGNGISVIEGSGNVVSQGNVARFNQQSGLRVEASSSNVLGSDVAGQGNSFSDNRVNGIVVTGGAGNGMALANVISGNAIQANGVGVGSATSGVGVLVTGSRTSDNVIGTRIVEGRVVGVGNEISGNLGYGVSVVSGARNAQIQSNSIYDNTLGAINRAAGSNFNVAAPRISSAVVKYGAATGPQVVVAGTVAGSVRQQLAIDVYATPAATIDSSVPVGGRVHLGRFTVTITSETGTSFTGTLPILTLTAGDLITATATTLSVGSGGSMWSTPIGSTSAMSAAVQLSLPVVVSSTPPRASTRRI